ncbi:Nif3-like dinuclear metal center hexameric protein [Legionella dresdenensis]|uniref:Nif3-like dinuclear metal center hexameric protein n=1 Tax=Legionella dresdenensis TaxID=450200 RepID=A0ABV8CH93_9GAMM
MINRQQLISYLDKLLGCANFNDYAPNGLQVQGCNEIINICTAVTASADVIDQASKMNAHALIVHHGYFWRGENPVITGIKYQRIAELIRCNINLLAYHLPLDCHVDLGNNACIAKLLELHTATTHKAGSTPGLLWTGAFNTARSIEDVSCLLAEKFGQQPTHIAGTSAAIKTIAWCSGAAQDFIEEAHALGADAYLSGEISERTYYQAKELGIHYFACGHHATERYGIQALGKHLAEQFGLQHYFIDSDNPI